MTLIHYNPAGLSHVKGGQSVFGSTAVGGSSEFKRLKGTESHGDFNGSINCPPLRVTFTVVPILSLFGCLPCLRSRSGWDSRHRSV